MDKLTVLNLRDNQINDITMLSGLTNLARLCLHNKGIVDIQALLANSGLSNGDVVDICGNYLDLTPSSPDLLAVETPQGRGVRITSELQN